MYCRTIVGALLLAARLSTAAPASRAQPGGAALCNNGGLQWAYYTDDTKTDSLEEDVAYDPTAVKTEKPVETGVTSYLRYNVQADSIGPNVSVYDNPTAQPSSYFALNHRGYLFASQTGDYTFEGTATDDVSYLWIGTKAFSGFDKNNDYIEAIYGYDELQPGPGYGFYRAPLVAGSYYPIRIVYKQGAGNAVFEYNIKDPNGNVLIGSDPSVPASNDIVQFSCDRVTAPPFAPFGSET